MKHSILLTDRTRGIGMTRLAFATLLLAGFSSAFATEVYDNQNALQAKMDSIDSKQGVEIGGTVRAVFDRSIFSSDKDMNGVNTTPDREQNEFAQFDLKLGFRPWDAVRANVVLRLGAGMQEYFYAASKTITVPWVNIEGHYGNTFYWVVGDFRQQISPLTIYSPTVDIMYEPEIYRRARYMAQDQVYLQGSQRNLQGINLQYRDGFGDILSEVRAEGILSRLRRIEFLDRSGAVGNILPNEQIAGASQSSGMNKFLASANFEAYPMNKNLMVGFTQMMIWDDANSLVREVLPDTAYVNAGGTDPQYIYPRVPINPFDTLPQNTSISSIRLGADGAGLMKNDNIILNLTMEYALSNDRVYQEWDSVLVDPATGSALLVTDASGVVVDTAKVLLNSKKDEKGSAMLVDLALGYQLKDQWMAKLLVNYMMNDSGWFNNIAQSPTFFPRRIMNLEKDSDLSKWGVRAPLYSTFDGLYHFTPKFTPTSSTLANNTMDKGQSESYNIAPFSKNSWTTAILTRKELEMIEQQGLYDPNVQLALPNGLATTNRVGFRLNPIAGFGKENLVEVQGLFAQLSQTQVPKGIKKAEFSEMGAGAKADVFGLIGWSLPLEISGSFKQASRKQGDTELKTQFVNAGLYFRYFKRLGFTAGFQMASMELNASLRQLVDDPTHTFVPVVKGNQNQWMVGLDYTLSKNAWLTINYGVINVENTYGSETPLAGTPVDLVDADGNVVMDPNTGTAVQVPSTTQIVPVSNFPDYLNAMTKPGTKEVVHKFTLNQIEASINVDF